VEQNALFRKSALDKLASPERLDVLMQVTSPLGWIALAAIGVVLAGALAWSVIYSIPEQVAGSGMLLRGSGNRVILATGSGTLESLRFKVGDTVQPGDIIGEVKGLATTEMGAGIQAELNRAQSDHDRTRSESARTMNTAKGFIADLNSQNARNNDEIARLEKRLEDRKKGLALGSYSQREVDDVQTELRRYLNERDRLRQQRDIRENEIKNAQDDVARSQAQLERVRAQLGIKGITVAKATRIESNVSGKIISLTKRVGDSVTENQPVATVASESGDLLGYMFVPSEEGSRIRPGMPVQIDLLNTYRREEYGTMRGTVRSVGAQPVSEGELMSLTANTVVVREILESGSKTRVDVTLTPDPQSPTGFAWSSGTGPAGEVLEGTQVAASVEVDSRRPISLVIPMLKGMLGAS
jgi:HlyD family secretion protein